MCVLAFICTCTKFGLGQQQQTLSTHEKQGTGVSTGIFRRAAAMHW